MANPTAKTAPHQIIDWSDLVLKIDQIQNEDGVVILDGDAAQQSTIADLAVTDVDPLTAIIKFVQTTVDASGGGAAQETAIATVPDNSLILAVHAEVLVSFDGDTTTTFEVGLTGNIDKYIDTADFEPETLNLGVSNQESTTADENIFESTQGSTEAIVATWTNDSSATAGSVRVTVVYIDFDDAALGTELATAFAEVETKVNAIFTALEDAGILADA